MNNISLAYIDDLRCANRLMTRGMDKIAGWFEDGVYIGPGDNPAKILRCLSQKADDIARGHCPKRQSAEQINQQRAA